MGGCGGWDGREDWGRERVFSFVDFVVCLGCWGGKAPGGGVWPCLGWDGGRLVLKSCLGARARACGMGARESASGHHLVW